MIDRIKGFNFVEDNSYGELIVVNAIILWDFILHNKQNHAWA